MINKMQQYLLLSVTGSPLNLQWEYEDRIYIRFAKTHLWDQV